MQPGPVLEYRDVFRDGLAGADQDGKTVRCIKSFFSTADNDSTIAVPADPGAAHRAGHAVRGEVTGELAARVHGVRFTEHLALEGIAPSIGSVGDGYDNCLMESIIGPFKAECIRPGPFVKGPVKTINDVEFATMAWVDW